MKKILIGTMCVAVAVQYVAYAARPSSLHRQETKMFAAGEGATQKVIARGVGKDKSSALKDAYRAAVEKAVGLYVDAETFAENDELVQDQVLTHSNAYIESYDELGMKELDSGLVQVRISAVVKKRELVETLGKVLPSGRSNGYTGSLKDIHAQIVSKEKRDTDGAVLLQNALRGIDPCTLLAIPSVDKERMKVIKEGEINGKGLFDRQIPNGQVILRTLLRLKFDEEKYYNSFVPTIKPVLDQIATASKKVKLSLLSDSERIDMTRMDDYLNIGPEYSKNRKIFRNHFYGKEMLLGQEPCMSPMRALYGGGRLMAMMRPGYEFGKSVGCEDVVFSSAGGESGWSDRSHGEPQELRNIFYSKGSVSIDAVVSAMDKTDKWNRNGGPTTVQLILVCGVNKAHTIWDAVFYQVDKKTAAAFMIWCNKYGSGYSGSLGHYGSNTAADTVQYNISYCDKSGDPVLMNKWQIPRIVLMDADYGKIGHYSNNWVLYISPFFGCFSEEYVQWHDALIKTDLLPEIESVKIELEN